MCMFDERKKVISFQLTNLEAILFYKLIESLSKIGAVRFPLSNYYVQEEFQKTSINQEIAV